MSDKSKTHAAAQRRLQIKGSAAVVATINAQPQPFVSLMDFAEDETKKKSAALRLDWLKKDLEAVMNLPGTGIYGSSNWRAKINLMAEIAECRKILGPPKPGAK